MSEDQPKETEMNNVRYVAIAALNHAYGYNHEGGDTEMDYIPVGPYRADPWEALRDSRVVEQLADQLEIHNDDSPYDYEFWSADSFVMVVFPSQ